MRRPEFSQGLADVRAGRSPNAALVDTNSGGYWSYERGRLLGAIMPLDWPLYTGRRLNPNAVELYRRSSCRRLIP